MIPYSKFIASKITRFEPKGFDVGLDQLRPEIYGQKHEFQPHVIQWALKLGCAAIFANYGMGKTLMQSMWAEQVAKQTGKRVLILAPWAVAHQTVKSVAGFGIEIAYCKNEAEAKDHAIAITNYDRLKDFDPSQYGGVVLDESSILKQYRGKTKELLVESFKETPYRLCCSATPAPNDWLELGNHSEFLGIMDSHTMISRWFRNDTTQSGAYSLRPYAQEDFWQWVSSWAVCMTRPSDLGFSDEGWSLPPLNLHYHTIAVDHASTQDDPDRNGQLSLIRTPTLNATSIHKEAKLNAPLCAEKIADLVMEYHTDAWVLWCFTDYEADALKESIHWAIDLRGSESAAAKEAKLTAFTEGEIQILITKPEIAGLGLNWQHCHRQSFMMGTSYSFEQFHQAIHRLYRHGQIHPVETHLVFPETASAVRRNIERKQRQHEAMQNSLRKAIKASRLTIHQQLKLDEYKPTIKMEIPQWLRNNAA